MTQRVIPQRKEMNAAYRLYKTTEYYLYRAEREGRYQAAGRLQVRLHERYAKWRSLQEGMAC